jgi:hypothetical protein
VVIRPMIGSAGRVLFVFLLRLAILFSFSQALVFAGLFCVLRTFMAPVAEHLKSDFSLFPRG